MGKKKKEEAKIRKETLKFDFSKESQVFDIIVGDKVWPHQREKSVLNQMHNTII